MSAALDLAWKDLRIYFRDRTGLLLGFLLPILLVTIFGFLMGAAFGGNGPTPKVVLYVADDDQTEASKKLVRALRASDMLRVRPRPEDPPVSAEEAKRVVDDGGASHALLIRPGFAESSQQPSDKTLLLIRDPGRTLEDQMVRIGLMQAMFATSSSGWWIPGMRDLFEDAGMAPDQLDLLQSGSSQMAEVINQFNAADDPGDSQQATESPSGSGDAMGFIVNLLPLATEDHVPPARPKQVSYQIAQAVAGMSVMMLMFGVTSAGRTLIQERDSGTLARLLSMGVPRQSILLGTVLFTVAIGILQMAVMFAYGEFMFQVGIFRDPVTLIGLAMLWIVTSASFGILIATGAKTEKQADMMGTILIISMAALGGCWFPLQMLDLPLPLELATKSTVTYWAMTGFQSMLWNGADLLNQRVLLAVGVQLGYLVAMAFIAWWLFRRNYLRG